MRITEDDAARYEYVCDVCGVVHEPDVDDDGDWHVPGIGGENGKDFVYLCVRCTSLGLILLRAVADGVELKEPEPEPARPRSKTFEFKIMPFESEYFVGHSFGTYATVSRAWLEFPGGSESLAEHTPGWNYWNRDLRTTYVRLDPEYFPHAIGGTLHVVVSE